MNSNDVEELQVWADWGSGGSGVPRGGLGC